MIFNHNSTVDNNIWSHSLNYTVDILPVSQSTAHARAREQALRWQ